MEQQEFSFAKFSFVDQLSIRMDFSFWEGEGKTKSRYNEKGCFWEGETFNIRFTIFSITGRKTREVDVN